MNAHQHQAVREAVDALDFAAEIARLAGSPEYAASYVHAAESLRLAFAVVADGDAPKQELAHLLGISGAVNRGSAQ